MKKKGNPYVALLEQHALAVQRIAFLEKLCTDNGINPGPTPFPRADYLDHKPPPAKPERSILANVQWDADENR